MADIKKDLFNPANHKNISGWTELCDLAIKCVSVIMQQAQSLKHDSIEPTSVQFLADIESQALRDKTYTASVKMLNIMIMQWPSKSTAQKAASLREYALPSCIFHNHNGTRDPNGANGIMFGGWVSE